MNLAVDCLTVSRSDHLKRQDNKVVRSQISKYHYLYTFLLHSYPLVEDHQDCLTYETLMNIDSIGTKLLTSTVEY